MLAFISSALVAISLAQVAYVRFFNPPFSAFMVEARFGPGPDFPLELGWTPLAAISPHLVRAILAAEDQRFFQHNGFDWLELDRAWEEGRDGGRLRGASTITMQTARNLFLWPGRSFVRKGLEAWYTMLMECLLPKSRILEIYLNVAEFGPGIWGAPAASRHYFRLRPSGLNRDQSARLAIVLPSPRRWSPLTMTRYLLSRKRFVLRHMDRVPLARE